jgi:hypothetical protein
VDTVLGIVATLVLVVIAGFVFGTLKSKLMAAIAFALIWAMTMALPNPIGAAFRYPCDNTVSGWYQDNKAELESSSSR